MIYLLTAIGLLPGGNRTVQYSTVQCSTVQYSAVQYSTVQCSAVKYSTVQFSAHVLSRQIFSELHVQNSRLSEDRTLCMPIYRAYLLHGFLIFNASLKNSQLDRDLCFNPSKIITFKFFPQPNRFSCTLLVFLIAV